MEQLVRTLGKEKVKVISENFDLIHDQYRKKAIDLGYSGELKFKKEKGNIIIFAVIENSK